MPSFGTPHLLTKRELCMWSEHNGHRNTKSHSTMQMLNQVHLRSACRLCDPTTQASQRIKINQTALQTISYKPFIWSEPPAVPWTSPTPNATPGEATVSWTRIVCTAKWRSRVTHHLTGTAAEAPPQVGRMLPARCRWNRPTAVPWARGGGGPGHNGKPVPGTTTRTFSSQGRPSPPSAPLYWGGGGGSGWKPPWQPWNQY